LISAKALFGRIRKNPRPDKDFPARGAHISPAEPGEIGRGFLSGYHATDRSPLTDHRSPIRHPRARPTLFNRVQSRGSVVSFNPVCRPRAGAESASAPVGAPGACGNRASPHLEGAEIPAGFSSDHPDAPETAANFSSDHPDAPETVARFSSDHPDGPETVANFSSDHPDALETPANFSSDHPDAPETAANFSSDHPDAPETPAKFSSDHPDAPKPLAKSPKARRARIFSNLRIFPCQNRPDLPESRRLS